LPLAGRTVTFGIGTEVRRATTDATGLASATLPLLQNPHDDTLRAVFDESTDFLGSALTTPFSITKQATTLSLLPGSFSGTYAGSLPFVATLSDPSSRRLRDQSVFFVLTGGGHAYATTAITDFEGRASLPGVPLPVGSYSVTVAYGGTIALGNGESVTQASDRFLPATPASAQLTITPRDARPTYTGALRASTTCRTCDIATVTASATIQDQSLFTASTTTASSAADVRTATVTFVDRASNTQLCTAPVGLVSVSETRVGTAACTWIARIDTQSARNFTVGLVIGGSYAHNNATDNLNITVTRPTQAQINADGTFALTHAAGLLNPDSTTTARFAADASSVSHEDEETVARSASDISHDHRSRGLPGHPELTLRSAGHTYRLVDETLTSLVVAPGPGSTLSGTLDGVVHIEDVTDPEHAVLVDDKALLQLSATSVAAAEPTDDGERQSNRSTPTVGISVWRSSGGLWFSSAWDGVHTLQQNLASGHLNAS
jgi:hypothetical protein